MRGTRPYIDRPRGAVPYLRHPPPMSGARGARPYLLCGAQCPALLLTCGALPSTGPLMCDDRPMRGDLLYLRQTPLTCGTRPYCLCAVPGFTFDTPAYAWSPGCFALLTCSALLRQGPGCFDSPRLPLMCFAVLCFASTAPGFASTAPGLPSTPPGFASYVGCFAWPYLLRALLCFALLCLLCLLTYLRVFYTY